MPARRGAGAGSTNADTGAATVSDTGAAYGLWITAWDAAVPIAGDATHDGVGAVTGGAGVAAGAPLPLPFLGTGNRRNRL